MILLMEKRMMVMISMVIMMIILMNFPTQSLHFFSLKSIKKVYFEIVNDTMKYTINSCPVHAFKCAIICLHPEDSKCSLGGVLVFLLFVLSRSRILSMTRMSMMVQVNDYVVYNNE